MQREAKYLRASKGRGCNGKITVWYPNYSTSLENVRDERFSKHHNVVQGGAENLQKHDNLFSELQVADEQPSAKSNRTRKKGKPTDKDKDDVHTPKRNPLPERIRGSILELKRKIRRVNRMFLVHCQQTSTRFLARNSHDLAVHITPNRG